MNNKSLTTTCMIFVLQVMVLTSVVLNFVDRDWANLGLSVSLCILLLPFQKNIEYLQESLFLRKQSKSMAVKTIHILAAAIFLVSFGYLLFQSTKTF